MSFHVKSCERYRALITLGMFESFASDDDIKAKLEDVGLVNVTVVGEGRYRWAFGTWPGEEQDVDLPGEVSQVEDMGPG